MSGATFSWKRKKEQPFCANVLGSREQLGPQILPRITGCRAGLVVAFLEDRPTPLYKEHLTKIAAELGLWKPR